MSLLGGIDVGVDAVRGVVVDPEQQRVVRWAEVPLPAEEVNEEGLAAALRALRRRLRTGGMAIGITSDMPTVVTRMALPFGEPRRIGDVVHYELESRLPFEVSEWVEGFSLTECAKDFAEVLAFAVRRKDAEALLSASLSAGIHPRVMVSRPAAIGALAVSAGDGQPLVIAWKEGERADIAAAGERLRVARSVRLTEQSGDAAGLDAAVTATAVAAGLCPEECETVVLPGQAGWLAAHIVPERGTEGAAGVQYAPAIGAALCAAEPWHVDVARSLRGAGGWLRATGPALTAALVAVLLAGCVFAVSAWRRGRLFGQVATSAQERITTIWRAAYGAEALPADPVARMVSDLRAASWQGEQDALRPTRPLERLRSATGALAPVEGLNLNGFRITHTGMVLACTAESLSAADRAVAALQEEFGGTAGARSPIAVEPGRYAFELRVAWGGPGR